MIDLSFQQQYVRNFDTFPLNVAQINTKILNIKSVWSSDSKSVQLSNENSLSIHIYDFLWFIIYTKQKSSTRPVEQVTVNIINVYQKSLVLEIYVYFGVK